MPYFTSGNINQQICKHCINFKQNSHSSYKQENHGAPYYKKNYFTKDSFQYAPSQIKQKVFKNSQKKHPYETVFVNAFWFPNFAANLFFNFEKNIYRYLCIQKQKKRKFYSLWKEFHILCPLQNVLKSRHPFLTTPKGYSKCKVLPVLLPAPCFWVFMDLKKPLRTGYE